MQKNISFKFYFSIFCTRVYDVSRITELLQLTPSKTWVKDESQEKPLYRDNSFWDYISEEQFSYSNEELFDEFLQPLEERKDLIVQLLEQDALRCDIDIVVVVGNANSMPALGVTAKQAALLAAFKCNVEFDIYDNRTTGPSPL